MFDGPEYVSYIALCRELQLERKAQAGDWFIIRDPQERPDEYDLLSMCGQDGHQCTDAPHWDDSLEVVWLPRLDQWLAMLEEVGTKDVLFEWSESSAPGYGNGGWVCFSVKAHRASQSGWESVLPEHAGWYEYYELLQLTREEAAARLWRAVSR